MEPTGWILLAFTGATMVVMGWKGREVERLAALAFICVILVTTFFDHVSAGGVRWVVAASSLGLFLALAGLSLRAARWWLLVAAGVQLVALATHVAAVFHADLQVWASVSIRYLVWLELMLLGLFGVWEARRAPYAHPHNRAPA